MNSPQVKVYVVEPDRNQIRIEWWQGERCVGRFVLGADEVDGLINHLALHREKMAKKIPLVLTEGQKIKGQVEPEWTCVFAKETQNQVLAMRHAGFGWIGFQLSANRARALAAALLNGLSPQRSDPTEPRRLH